MNKKSPAKLVKSAIRTIDLFSAFAEAKRPLSLSELAKQIRAPKSSCHELVQTLTYLGYIIVIEGGKAYYPSRRLYDMASGINSYNPIKEKIQSCLKALRDSTGETVLIGKLQGAQVVYSEVLDGTHIIRYSARSGDLKSIHASALGKALLASLDDKEQKALIAQLKLTRYTEKTLTTKKALKENLSRGLAQDIFTTVGEHLPDVMALAHPVNISGHKYAIGIAGPIPRMQKNQKQYSNALLDTVNAIAN